MKRLTSILLALAMVLTLLPMNIFAAGNTSFSDVNGTEYFSAAANALEKLGILAGYPDGTFGAEKSITRAEMAAIVCRMIEKETDAEKAEGKTDFDDVASSHWASGYIKIASKEGIINGDGNGKFRPEDDVKYEEAIKMVVCALGLGDDVKNDEKDWSAGYIKVADDKGITGNLKGTKGKAATRGDIAVMSYNGLKNDLDAPTASLASGSYTGTKSVTLTTATKDADIYYTTDGKNPTAKSTKYTKAVSISKTTTLKAIAVKEGVIVSDVMSVDYTIKASSVGGGGGGGSSSSNTKYTVSFDLNYEGATGAPANQSVKKGEKATEPEIPTREGYVFGGWYIEKSCNDESKFLFTNAIYNNIMLYANWKNSASTDDVSLSIDNNELEAATDNEVVFYVETSLDSSKVEVVNDDNSISVELFDNGDFENNRDDIEGDGIYSGKYILNYETENLDGFDFHAQVYTDGGMVESKGISVYSISDIDDYEFAIMNTVDNLISDMIINKFSGKTLDERKNIAFELLEKLSSDSHGIEGYDMPLVVPGSISEYKDSKTIDFLYAIDSGVNGTIMLEEFDDNQKGEDVISTDRGSKNNNAIYNKKDSVPLNLLSSSSDDTKPIKTLVLHNFMNEGTSPSYAESSWVNAYNNYVENELGDISNIDTVTGATVEDYKSLFGYDAIIINSHGSYLKNDPVICLNQIASENNYVNDIKMNRIYRANTSSGVHYWLFPKFFEYYYGAKKLNGSIVYLGLCLGYGDKVIDSDMANAWMSAGSDTVYAYLNSVNGSYDYYMLEDILSELSDGKTTLESLQYAKEQNGNNDGGSPAAIMHIHGKTDRYLIKTGLLNGSFEDKFKYWSIDGDSRIISKLAELNPTNENNMAIVTTGIGSGISSYLNATEGSVIYQTFKVPGDKTTISFDYNVISEEPMEYVNSQYDDTFVAIIADGENEVTIAEESVNKASWHYIDGIDFEGGDETTYHTEWKTIKYDISDYRGKIITIKFVVFDVGDSIYDTATIIDNVILE